MTNESDRRDQIGLSRRTLALATGVAALGVALGMRSTAFAQGKADGKGEGKADAKIEGKGEGKAEAKGEGKTEGKGEGKGEGKAEGKGEGKVEGKGEGKAEGKGEGKFDGKQGRLDGKAGRIKIDVASDGTTAVDVRCADGEPMQVCADVTQNLLDRMRAPK